MDLIKKILALYITATPSLAQSEVEATFEPPTKADIQFFGDTYLPIHVLEQTASTSTEPKMFEALRPLLQNAKFNVVNFEGVVTAATIPHEFKQFLLRMSLAAPAVLRAANISVATLANNHSYDFGYPGLFDTLVSLEAAGISTIGAGRTLDDAARPLILPSNWGTICLYAFSRVWPASFWASENSPGTAYLSVDSMTKKVRDCATSGYFTIVTFHWGVELSNQPQVYQSYLAKLMVDAGAQAVIGHHPHVLQPLEIYRNKPILYSLGNFAFGSLPAHGKQQGMAASLFFSPINQVSDEFKLVLTPLNVSNARVSFKPRLTTHSEKDPIAPLLPAGHPCIWDKEKRHWECLFKTAS